MATDLKRLVFGIRYDIESSPVEKANRAIETNRKDTDRARASVNNYNKSFNGLNNTLRTAGRLLLTYFGGRAVINCFGGAVREAAN